MMRMSLRLRLDSSTVVQFVSLPHRNGNIERSIRHVHDRTPFSHRRTRRITHSLRRRLLSGTWKLNTAKSKYSPGPAPKSTTQTYSMDGDWVVLKSEGVAADGKPANFSYRYKFDGKEYPFKNATVDGTISVKRIDDLHTEAVIKGGKANISLKGEISKDGKTRTQRQTGTNAEGKPVNNVVVYEKQ